MDEHKKTSDVRAAIFDTSEIKAYSHEARDEVAELIAEGGYKKVLDLDCGTGLLLEQLLNKRNDIEATGFDYSLTRLHQAKERLKDKGVDLRFGQAIRLPFEDKSFDAVVSTTTFHHYKQPKRVLKEIRRVLKPGGDLIICDTYLSSTLRYLNSMSKPLNEVADMTLYSKKDIWKLLNSTGFTGVTWRLMNKFAYLVKASASEMPLIHEF